MAGSASLGTFPFGALGGHFEAVPLLVEAPPLTGGDAVALDVDQAEVGVIGFLGIFVDETTRVDAGHLRVVEGADFLE